MMMMSLFKDIVFEESVLDLLCSLQYDSRMNTC